jgi:hypothetical protein
MRKPFRTAEGYKHDALGFVVILSGDQGPGISIVEGIGRGILGGCSYKLCWHMAGVKEIRSESSNEWYE